MATDSSMDVEAVRRLPGTVSASVHIGEGSLRPVQGGVSSDPRGHRVFVRLAASQFAAAAVQARPA
jgi:hypothetical protein